MMTNFLWIMLAVIGFTACNQTDNKQAKNDEEAETVPTENVSEQQSAYTAPDVSFTDEHGETVSLGSLKGKVVFINFWATWCPPCIQELPSIQTLKQSFGNTDDIVFLMVDVDNKIEKSSTFMKKNKFDLPVYVPASNIPSEFLENAIPTTVVLDRKGGMVVRAEGARDYADPGIVKAIKDLIESE